jgi:hypothetical protein
MYSTVVLLSNINNANKIRGQKREAAFWLVSEMFILISVKMPQNRGWSFRGSIKKNGYPNS